MADVAALEHAVVRPAGVGLEGAIAKTLASESFDVGETTAPMEALTAAALMALDEPAGDVRKRPVLEDTLPQPTAAPIAKATPQAAKEAAAKAAKPSVAKAPEAAPTAKPGVAKAPAAAAAPRPPTPAARQPSPAAGKPEPVKPEAAAATQRGVAPPSTSRTPEFVRKQFIAQLKRTTPGVGTSETSAREALPLPIVTPDTPVRAPVPARDRPRAPEAKAPEAKAPEAKAPAAVVQKQPARPIIPPEPVKPAAAAVPAPAAAAAPPAAAADRISDVPTLMRKSSPDAGATAEPARERALPEAAAPLPDVGQPTVERVYNDRISDAPTVLRKAVGVEEIEQAELQAAAKQTELAAAAKQAEPEAAAPLPQVAPAPPPTTAEPEVRKPQEAREPVEVKHVAAVEAPAPVEPVEAPAPLEAVAPVKPVEAPAPLKTVVAPDVAEPAPAKPAPAAERVQPAPPEAPVEEAPRPRKGAPGWLIGLAAAVLLAGIVFNGLRTGWLHELFGTTPAPTSTSELPAPPPSGALVPPTQPSHAAAAPSETARSTATITAPLASAAATPPTASATAPAPSATAPAMTATPADTSSKPPTDPAKLPLTRGYLMINTKAPGSVYITGRPVGVTGQPIEMSCGLKFVRIAEPGKADPPKWVTPGQSVHVVCQALTTVSF